MTKETLGDPGDMWPWMKRIARDPGDAWPVREEGDIWPYSVKDMRIAPADLIGHELRIIQEDTEIMPSYQPGRVTIYLSKDNRIVEIGIEPGGD